SLLGLTRYITIDHLEKLAKIMLGCGLMVCYVYISEFFATWYSNSPYERGQYLFRLDGNYAWAFWTTMTCNMGIIQLLWFRAVRRSLVGLMLVGIAVNVGMWFERFVIIALSLMHGFMPSAWDNVYAFTAFDWMILAGSFGVFITLLLAFSRIIPMVSIAELKADLLKPGHASGDGAHAAEGHGHG